MQHLVSNSLDKQQQLRLLDKTIVAREKYRACQEALINDLAETGNSKLMELTYDIQLAKKQLRDLRTDIRTAAQDKVLLLRDLDELRNELPMIEVTMPVFRSVLG
jgi:hypothetical protein